MHCTGWKAKVALEKELGEGIVPTGVGHRVEVQGSRVGDDTMWVEIAE
jgi:7,8-dihydropterin-6-yl-methyl-4-(beta-D-ribofuranosyl)aminobenzene 5'-phosphate synthase